MFIGTVTDFNDTEMEVEVALLVPSLPSATLSWPSEDSSHVIPYPPVLCRVTVQPSCPMEYNTSEVNWQEVSRRAKARLQSFKRR